MASLDFSGEWDETPLDRLVFEYQQLLFGNRRCVNGREKFIQLAVQDPSDDGQRPENNTET